MHPFSCASQEDSLRDQYLVLSFGQESTDYRNEFSFVLLSKGKPCLNIQRFASPKWLMKSPIKFYNNTERSSSVYIGSAWVSMEMIDARDSIMNWGKKTEVRHTNEPLSIAFACSIPISYSILIPLFGCLFFFYFLFSSSIEAREWIKYTMGDYSG